VGENRFEVGDILWVYRERELNFTCDRCNILFREEKRKNKERTILEISCRKPHLKENQGFLGELAFKENAFLMLDRFFFDCDLDVLERDADLFSSL
jgi:hypothetical protein